MEALGKLDYEDSLSLTFVELKPTSDRISHFLLSRDINVNLSYYTFSTNEVIAKELIYNQIV